MFLLLTSSHYFSVVVVVCHSFCLFYCSLIMVSCGRHCRVVVVVGPLSSACIITVVSYLLLASPSSVVPIWQSTCVLSMLNTVLLLTALAVSKYLKKRQCEFTPFCRNEWNTQYRCYNWKKVWTHTASFGAFRFGSAIVKARRLSRWAFARGQSRLSWCRQTDISGTNLNGKKTRRQGTLPPLMTTQKLPSHLIG